MSGYVVINTTDKQAETNSLRARGGGLVTVIEENKKELLSGFRDSSAYAFEEACELRITDLLRTMSNNRDHSSHLELLGRVAQLREIIATIHYARM